MSTEVKSNKMECKVHCSDLLYGYFHVPSNDRMYAHFNKQYYVSSQLNLKQTYKEVSFVQMLYLSVNLFMAE